MPSIQNWKEFTYNLVGEESIEAILFQGDKKCKICQSEWWTREEVNISLGVSEGLPTEEEMLEPYHGG